MNSLGNSISALRRFAPPASLQEQPGNAREYCELCNLALETKHRHLLETAKRQITCACDGCALRFQNVVGGRFKLIPRDARACPGFQLSGGQWENLAIPINLAFLFYHTDRG